MTTPDEIARLDRIVKALGAARSTRDWLAMEKAHAELRDYSLPALTAERDDYREKMWSAATDLGRIRAETIEKCAVAAVNAIAKLGLASIGGAIYAVTKAIYALGDKP